jgi:sialic acid synthase SpsE
MSRDAMYVCAEIGVNWRGDRDILGKVVKDAIGCGVDAVKLQMFDESVISDSPLKEQLKKMIIDEMDILEVASVCHANSVDCVVTAMYPKAVEILNGIAIDGIKVRAKDWWKDEIMNPLRETDKAVYVSVPYRTGDMYTDDIPEEAKKRLPELFGRTRGKKRYRVYCLNDYPPTKAFMNQHLVDAFDGVSLHSPDWYDYYASAAIAIQKQYNRGDKRKFYIEAHLLNAHIPWAQQPDAEVSLNTHDMKMLSKACDELEETIG